MKEYNGKRHFGYAMTPKMHAILFSNLVKEILEEDPKTGEETIKFAVNHYGMQRGNRMRQRVENDKEEPNLLNYLAYGEWLSVPGEMDVELKPEGKDLITTAKKCIWETVWEEFDHIKYGKYYCKYIDPAIIKGYNDEMTLKIIKTKTDGNQECQFCFKDNTLSNEEIEKLEEKRKEIGLRDKEPWEYHIAHLYYAFEDILEVKYSKEKTEKILNNSIKNLSQIYGFDFKDLVEEYSKEEFSKARIRK